MDGDLLNLEGATATDMVFGEQEIAEFLRVNVKALPRLIRDEGLPVTRIGLRRVATRRQLTRWIETRAAAQVGV